MRAGGAVPLGVFAALTAILRENRRRKYQVQPGDIHSHVVVLFSFLVSLPATGQLVQPSTISGRTWTFLIRSGLGTGASRLCYFRAPKPGPASLVAPVDKLNVVLVVIFGVLAFGERPFSRARHVDYARIASNLPATAASMRARFRLLPNPEIAGSFNDEIGNAEYVPFTVS
jgi:bacterial/archaeal transporter family protein